MRNSTAADKFLVLTFSEVYISHVQNSRHEKLKQLHYYFVQSRDITDFCVSDVSASASRLRNFKISFFEEHCSLHSSLSILPFFCG